jgi:hypothetical protein
MLPLLATTTRLTAVHQRLECLQALSLGEARDLLRSSLMKVRQLPRDGRF